LNSLLLDANVIIDANKLGFWDSLITKNKIYIASTVLRNEVFYYINSKKQQKDIHLLGLARRKRIIEVSATVSQQQSLMSKFDLAFAPKLHSGEIESLSILQRRNDLIFCTFDKAAIMALVLLGIAHRGISLERALFECGLNRHLERKHSEKKFKYILKQAKQMRIMGQGLSEDIL